MKKIKIDSFIKTPCGRSKYQYLASKNGFFAKIRLTWFIIFATIKDWNLQDDRPTN